jgi:hypothetical protein
MWIDSYPLHVIMSIIEFNDIIRSEGGIVWIGPYPLYEVVRCLSLHFLASMFAGLLILFLLLIIYPNCLDCAVGKDYPIKKHLYWIFFCFGVLIHILEDYVLGLF